MAVAISVRVDFVDGTGQTSFTKIRIPTGFSIAQMVEFAQGAAQVVANMSDAQVTGASITVDFDLTGLGLRVVANAASEVARKAFFQFTSTFAALRAKFKIPTFDEILTTLGSDSINQAAAPVATFIASIENGIVVIGGTMIFTNNRTFHIAALELAYEQHSRRN